MEVSSLLVDTYKRYKKGSAIVVSWMATTAAKYQNIEHLLVKGPRLKGKARAEARQADGSLRHGKIPLSSFCDLVAILSRAGIKMSQNTEIILWDVIKARKECAAFYRYQPEKSNEHMKSDEGHQYFIDILQHVYTTLRRPGHGALQTAADYKPQIHQEHASNIFEYLHPEEIQDLEDTGSISIDSYFPAKATRPTKYVIEQSLEQRQQERSFAIFCFLKDLTAIRLFVHRGWRDWKERRVTLATASVTANIAIEILRRINESFLIDYPEFDTHDKVVEALLYLNDRTHTYNPSVFKDISGWYILDDFKLSPETFCCKETLDVYFTGHLFKQSELLRVHWNPKSKTAETERSHMKHCLDSFTIMMGISTAAGMAVQQCDLLIKAIKAAHDQGQAPTWVVFAFQMFVDMHRELGSGARRGYKELTETSNRLHAGIKAHLLFTKSYSDRIGHIWYDRCKVEIKDFLQALTLSATHSNSNDLEQMACEAEVMTYYENHPAVCGTMIQSFLIQSHLLGIEAAAIHERIMFVCHLYNAGLQHHLLSPRFKWADLEYIIIQQGVSRIFVGERPTYLEDCCKRLHLVTGERPSEKARRERQKRGTRTNVPRGHKSTRFIGVFSTLVQQDYHHDGLVRVRHCPDDVDVTQPAVILERLVRRRLKDLSKSIKSPRAAQNAANRDLTPLQTLSTYYDAMKADEFALRFDTLTPGVIAMQILRIVSNTIDQAYTGEANVLDEPWTYFAVDLLMSSSIPNDPFYGVVGTRPKVWSLIQQIIERVGNLSYTRALAEQCIVALPRNPAHEAQFPSTAAIFGGPNSPESPSNWDDSWDRPSGHGAYEYRALPWELKTEKQILEYQARDEFMQKLITIPWKTDNLEGIARHLGLDLW